MFPLLLTLGLVACGRHEDNDDVQNPPVRPPENSENDTSDTSTPVDSGDTTAPITDADGDGIEDTYDCAPADATLYDLVAGYKDSDGDTYVAAALDNSGTSQETQICAGDADGDGNYDTVETNASLTAGDDCDDSWAYIHPNTYQAVNNVDTNCDGSLAVDISTDAVTLLGEDSDASAGNHSIAFGNINGDPYDDLVVGAIYGYANDTVGYAGAVYLYQGSNDFFGTLGAQTLTPAEVTITGSMPSEGFGSGIGMTDVNGNGKADLLVGAHGYNNSAATWYDLGDGTNSGAIALFYDNSISSATDTSSADALIIGEEDDGIGYPIYLSGTDADGFPRDINGDGYGEIVTPINTSNSIEIMPAAEYYGTVSTSDIPTLRITDDLDVYFSDMPDHVSIGDVNGDGYADILLGNSNDGPNGGQGIAYLIFGNSDLYGNEDGPENLHKEINLSELQPSSNIKYLTLTGSAINTAAGSTVNLADLDGDNLADILIGANWDPTAASYAGATYVIYGKDIVAFSTKDDSDEDTGDSVPDDDTDTVDLSSNGSNIVLDGDGDVAALHGHVLYSSTPNSELPTSVAISDTDGDNAPDVLISSIEFSENGSLFYVNSAVLTSLTTPSGDIATTAQQQIEGTTELTNFGNWLAGGGDINGDGAQDIAVSDPNAESNAGAIVILPGGPI